MGADPMPLLGELPLFTSCLEVAFWESNFRLKPTSIGNILLFIVTSVNEES